MAKAKKGYIIYEGPSLLDFEPIVAIATFNSKNDKTGDMVQTWILRRDCLPTAAAKQGLDSSVCGNCPHRPVAHGSCYVNLAFAPNGVFKAYQRGLYPVLDTYDRFTGKQVRFGSYGDPAAVPAGIWRAIAERASGHTGYTHSWRLFDLQDICMASVDTPSERALAKSQGWRTYRITTDGEQKTSSESVCPASSAAPTADLIQCADCMACDGTARDLRGDILIQIHGTKPRINSYNALRAVYQPMICSPPAE